MLHTIDQVVTAVLVRTLQLYQCAQIISLYVRDVIGVHVCVEQKGGLEAHLRHHLRIPLGCHVHRVDDDRLNYGDKQIIRDPKSTSCKRKRIVVVMERWSRVARHGVKGGAFVCHVYLAAIGANLLCSSS